MIELENKKTALILIDLQNGIISQKTEPESALYVLKYCKSLARKFREAKSNVIIVNVDFGKDGKFYPKGEVSGNSIKHDEHISENWSQVSEGLIEKDDIVITKHQWGAFTGTELDNILKSKGVDTIVLAGIATNFGVESTARQAWEFGYNVIVAEDCCSTTIDADAHHFSINKILPRISKVVRSGIISFKN